jgi:hypothetical protein
VSLLSFPTNADRTHAFAGLPRERRDDLKVSEDKITIEVEARSSRDPGEAGRRTRGSNERIAKRSGRRGEN